MIADIAGFVGQLPVLGPQLGGLCRDLAVLNHLDLPPQPTDDPNSLLGEDFLTDLVAGLCLLGDTETHEDRVRHLHQDVVHTVDVEVPHVLLFQVLQDPLAPESPVQPSVAIRRPR